MRRIVLAVVILAAVTSTRGRATAEPWQELKSAHFTVWSNGNDGQARTLLWQLEQIRSAVKAMWPWAQVDLGRPVLVLAVKDEQSMKALAPGFWERKGGLRPTSVWVTGADQHYMAIRLDQRGEDTATINPYTSTYFMYVNLILTSSFGRELPLWFSRGLAGVLSNTLVRDKEILLGPPIPWHLETLRTEGRLRLNRLLSVTRTSPEYTQASGLSQFDAQSWAFLHFLMFGEGGAHRPDVNRFALLLNNGADSDAAFVEAFGRVEDVEGAAVKYIQQSVFSYQRLVVDAGTKREQFTARPIAPADAAAGRAAFHVAMGRPTEARTLIDESRKLDPNAATTYLAEGLLLERDGKRADAKNAYIKATELGTTSAYAYYRSAMSTWADTRPDAATLRKVESSLARAVELNPGYARSYSGLGEVRAALGEPSAEVIALLSKAIALDPSDAWIRMAAARALWHMDKLEEARKIARIALTLADDDAARTEAQRLLSMIPESSASTARQPAPTSLSPSANRSTSTAAAPGNSSALVTACQGGSTAACRELFPLAEAACTGGERRACLVAARLQSRGQGVAKDEARAFATFERLCDENMFESCTEWAMQLASGQNEADLPRARALLTKSCTGGFAQACQMLKGFPK